MCVFESLKAFFDLSKLQKDSDQAKLAYNFAIRFMAFSNMMEHLVTITCILLVPPASPLIGMLMFGNFLRECKVTERLNKAAQNELINVITIFLGTSVGITMTGDRFLRRETLGILVLGVLAFGIATASGVLMAKFMNLFCKNKINPLIGSAGVSAVPMAARVSQVEGQKADPGNFLLMHAMGPNVAGVIGTALVAGFFLTMFGGAH